MSDHKSFVTTSYGMRGYFALQLWWAPEHGGFWEPWQTGFGSYATADEAAVEGRQWAEAEGLEFIPAPPEQHDSHIWTWRLHKLNMRSGKRANGE